MQKILVFALFLIISTIGIIETYAVIYPDGPGFACVQYYSSVSDLSDWVGGKPRELEQYIYLSYEQVGDPVEIKYCGVDKLPEGDFNVSHSQTILASMINIRRIQDPQCSYLVTRRFLYGTRGVAHSDEICSKAIFNKNYSSPDTCGSM